MAANHIVGGLSAWLVTVHQILKMMNANYPQTVITMMVTWCYIWIR